MSPRTEPCRRPDPAADRRRTARRRPAVEGWCCAPSGPAASPRPPSACARAASRRSSSRSWPGTAASWSAACGSGRCGSASAPAIFFGPIAVEPDFRSHGLGAALIERACDGRRGRAAMRLIVLVGDMPFFGPLGFCARAAGDHARPGRPAPRAGARADRRARPTGSRGRSAQLEHPGGSPYLPRMAEAASGGLERVTQAAEAGAGPRPAAGAPVESGPLRRDRHRHQDATACGSTRARRSAARRWCGCSPPCCARTRTASISSRRSRR